MPGRRKRECKKVGCHVLTDSADGYCEQHKKEKWAAGDERRKSARERGYDTQWEKYRKEFLLQHPLCEDCLSKKILRTATVVAALRGLPQQKDTAHRHRSGPYCCT